MDDILSQETLQPIGHAWLRRELDLPVPRPFVESHVVPGRRRTKTDGLRIVELYPRAYAPNNSVASHLRFALRHEPIDLSVLAATFRRTPAREIESLVRARPTGSISRRAWFFYEFFTGKTLDLEDTQTGNYVAALDPSRHFVSSLRKSKRHRVSDNLLGGPGMCISVRCTERLLNGSKLHMDKKARDLIKSHDPNVVTRAVSFLYTKETQSSFQIEGESPSGSRAERFVAALRSAPEFDPNDKDSLVRLQGEIVDSRYAASDWRQIQNFVGSTIGGYRQQVHFICPRPDDVPSLMGAWMSLTQRLKTSAIDPIVATAASAFAFVLVHPFEDGNGRIHRFLMHHMLAEANFGPPGVIFPISAAILRDRRGYDEVFETFWRRIAPYIQWQFTAGEMISVRNETADLYRYFDATPFAEYLYDRVADTIQTDLEEELGFIQVFDQAFNAIRMVVEMPDQRASLFVRFCMQNGGRLAVGKRSQFSELADEEIEAMEAGVQAALKT